MSVIGSSTIAALCYARTTAVNFRDLATDLSEALWDTQDGNVRLDMSIPDTAFCDLPGMRVGLAHVRMRRAFPGSPTGRVYPECILLSVGPGEAPSDTPCTQAQFDQVRQLMTGRIQDAVAADRMLLYARGGLFDIEALGNVVEGVHTYLDEALSARPAKGAGKARVGKRRAPEPVTGVTAASPDEMVKKLALRVDAELEQMETARRAKEASRLFIAPRPRRPGLRLVVPRLFPGRGPSTSRLLMSSPPNGHDDYPDYDHMPANVDDRPLLHRAAVNAMNAAVMTFALPVGAALLTMAVLGREDMLISTRATAITGTLVGISNTGLLDGALKLFS